MERISKHISYAEGVISATGTRLGIANKPTPAILENMKQLAVNIFEPLREGTGSPIRIISFYRSPALNRAVGGATASQHMTGEAADIQGTGDVSNADLFNYIKNNLPFDQLIWEFGTDTEPAWVHVSFSKKPRRAVLKAEKVKGKTIYKTI